MTLADYEYRGLMAEAWDVLRGDTSQWPDRAFYLEIIRQHGDPALDIGCATGRLLLDYLQHGIDIDGVDNSPEVLEICRQKAAAIGLSPALYTQHMEALALPRRYRTILIPSSSLQLVIDPALVLQALQGIRAHLMPGGIVAASLMTLWHEGEALESAWEASATREDGITFRRVARSRYVVQEECDHTEDLYQMIVDGVVVKEEMHRRSPATRSYTPAQAEALFSAAGFSAVRLYSGFTFEAVRENDTLFVVVARNPD